MSSNTPESQAPQPPSGQIVVDPRLAWGLVSAVAMAVGSIGTWVTAGPFSVSGTAGGGDGWITLGIAVAIGIVVAIRRLPWLVLPGAIVAGGIGIGDAIRFLDVSNDNEWFSVSLGWGLVIVIVAALSLAAWSVMAVRSTPPQQRVVAAVLTVLALAGAVALGVTDRTDNNDSGNQALSTETSDDNAEPTDWDTSTETSPSAPAESEPAPTTTEEAPAADDCDALGINSDVLNEGACTDSDGRKLRVVDRGTPLVLNEIAVRDVSVNLLPQLPGEVSGPHRASGEWVQITMTIRNEGSQPLTIDRRQFSLSTSEAQYTTDFDAMNEPGESCIWGAPEIQPGNETTCWIAFDVAKKNAKNVPEDGNLVVVQPSDVDSESAESRIGVIRLYQ